MSDRPSRVRLYLELGKARLNGLVLITTAVGFIMVAGEPFPHWLLVFTLLGTLLTALGSGALNCIIEIDRDREMKRTARRPLPAGLISRREAWVFALVCTIGGITMLALGVNLLTALLGLITVVVYIAIYTPMKTRSTLSTLAGGICGALPPMMGVTAVTNEVTTVAWVLGGILFVWQIPHFLALAWMYRADYEKGGYRMLPLVDPGGHFTARQTILYSIALLPLAFAATLAGATGWVYAVGALILGALMVHRAIRFAGERSARNARRLFLFTLLYLPVLLLLMVLDRGPVVGPFTTRATGPPAGVVDTPPTP
ncbi:MAG: heme o synthase [Planctomycetota bacterium]